MDLDDEWIINRKLGHKKAMALILRAQAAGLKVYQGTLDNCVNEHYPYFVYTVGWLSQNQPGYFHHYLQKVSYQQVMDALEERIKQQCDESEQRLDNTHSADGAGSI